MLNTLPALALIIESGQPFGDENDFYLLNESFGVRVTFLNPAVPFCYPAEQMQGTVIDVRTNKDGRRSLLVKADKLNLPKWVPLQDVQFIAGRETATALTAEAVNAA